MADGKVYLGTQKSFWVLAAGREKKILNEIHLGAPVYATPVAANGVLYVASQRYLWAVQMDMRAMQAAKRYSQSVAASGFEPCSRSSRESSLDYDCGEKSDLYAAAGIAEYWIVNLPDRRIEVRAIRPGRVSSRKAYAGDENPAACRAGIVFARRCSGLSARRRAGAVRRG